MFLRFRKTFASRLAIVCPLVLSAVCWAPGASALEFPKLKLPSISLPSVGFNGKYLSGNYYGGAGFGGSSLEPQLTQSGYTATDNGDGGAQLFFGRDLTTRISIEGYYSDLGQVSLSSEDAPPGRIDYSTIGASALVYLLGSGGIDSLADRRGLNLYARVGAGWVNNQGLGIEFDRANDFALSGGFGAEFNLRNGFGLRSEVHTFDTDARVVSFNIVKRFRVQNNGGRLPVILDKADTPLLKSDKDVAAKKNAALLRKDSDDDGINDRDDLCDSSEEGAKVDDYGCDFSGVIEGVTFNTASANLTSASRTALNKVVTQLKHNRDVNITVEAHTDNRGSASKNMALSRARAESVVSYLVNRGKIDVERITATGFGESRPIKSNQTQAGRLANRRVEIKVNEK